MDEVVTSQYRKLMEKGFENAGSFENPTMFIDSKAEGVSVCGQAGTDYMNIYVMAPNGVVEDIRYLCSCDPAANVVVEVLCKLARGKTLEEAKALTKEQFFEAIGSDGGSVRRKVWGMIELMNRVINRYEMRQAEKRADLTAKAQ